MATGNYLGLGRQYRGESDDTLVVKLKLSLSRCRLEKVLRNEVKCSVELPQIPLETLAR